MFSLDNGLPHTLKSRPQLCGYPDRQADEPVASILGKGAESCLNVSQPLIPQCLLCFSGSRDGHILQLPQCGQIFVCKGCVRNLQVSELGRVAFGGGLSLQSCVLSASSSMQDWTRFHMQPSQHAPPFLSVSPPPGAPLHPVAIPDGLGRDRPFCVIQCQHCLSMSRIGHSLQWSIVQCDFVCWECLQDARLPSFWRRCPRPASFNRAGLPSLQVANALRGGLQGPVHPQQAAPRIHSASSGRQAGVSCVVHCNQFESVAESGPTPQFAVTPGAQDAHEPNFTFPVSDLCLDPELMDPNPNFCLRDEQGTGFITDAAPNSCIACGMHATLAAHEDESVHDFVRACLQVQYQHAWEDISTALHDIVHYCPGCLCAWARRVHQSSAQPRPFGFAGVTGPKFFPGEVEDHDTSQLGPVFMTEQEGFGGDLQECGDCSFLECSAPQVKSQALCPVVQASDISLAGGNCVESQFPKSRRTRRRFNRRCRLEAVGQGQTSLHTLMSSLNRPNTGLSASHGCPKTPLPGPLHLDTWSSLPSEVVIEPSRLARGAPGPRRWRCQPSGGVANNRRWWGR